MTQPPPPSTPPGWYPDPDDTTMLRWWDGRQWTDDWQLVPQQPKKRSGLLMPLLAVAGVLCGAFLVLLVIVVATSSDTESGTNDSGEGLPARTFTRTSTDTSAALESSRIAEAERLRLADKSSYGALTSREWQLVAKNPVAHIGELYVIYGVVTQADSATGSYSIRVNTDGQQVDTYDFDINTIVTAGQASFDEVVEDDLVTLWVRVEGSETYETTMGGSVTAPKVEANIVEVYGNAG